MGRQNRLVILLFFLGLILASGSTSSLAQSLVPFRLPPIPPPKQNQSKQNSATPDQFDFMPPILASPNLPELKNINSENSNALDPDIAFVPIDQAVTKGRPYFNGVVLVAKDSQVIFEHSYDPYKKTYSDEDVNRQFLLGSMTKQFTAILILKLVDKKIIDLDDSIQKYFPGTPKSWANIKIKNLLNHTSGFTYEYLSYDYPCPFRSEEIMLSTLKKINPTSPPGTNFKYVNMNYALLGKIIEQVMGQNLAQVIQSEITGPLSMDLAGMIGPKVGDSEFNATQPVCYFGVGNMYSSPRDLLKLENALFNDKTILSEETFRKMVSPDVSTHHYYSTIEKLGRKKVVVGVPDSYGLGIRIQEVDGETIYWHSGHVSTYTALFEYYPRNKVTVVVLANKKNEKVFDIAYDAINAVLSLPAVPGPVYKSKVARRSSRRKRVQRKVKPKIMASNRGQSNNGP